MATLTSCDRCGRVKGDEKGLFWYQVHWSKRPDGVPAYTIEFLVNDLCHDCYVIVDKAMREAMSVG